MHYYVMRRYQTAYMKKIIIRLLIINSICAEAQKMADPIKLPNGWSLSPAGTSFPLGDLPLNMIVSKKNDLIAVTNNGQSKQSIQLVDVATQKIIDSVEIEKSWYGLAFGSNDRYLYVSGG